MHPARGLVLLAASAALAAPAARGQEPAREDKALLAAFERRLKATVEAAGPSVATVVVSRSEFYPKAGGDTPGKLGGFDPREFVKADPTAERAVLAKSLDLSDPRLIPDHGFAGGVVIDSAGFVLTPYHVIDGAKKVYVFLPGGAGSYADVHAADARSDLAVLRLINPPPKLPAVRFADVRTAAAGGRPPTVFPGKLCVLIAGAYSPTFALDRPSASFGGVTNVRHRVTPKDQTSPATRYVEYGPLLEYDLKLGGQTAGGVNATVTGGALFNLDGELIGLTNAAAVAWGTEVGPGYAVPADDLFQRIVGVLRKGEEVEYGFLGVQRIPGQIDELAIEPIPGGPAAAADVLRGERIKKVNGVPVATFDDLQLHIGSALAGSRVTVTVVSVFGRERDVDVTLGKYRNEQPFVASVRPEPVFGLRVDFPSIVAQRERKEDRPAAIPAGVGVREIAPKSPAEAKFNALGDNPQKWVVTAVNGTPVTTPAEFYEAAKGKEKVKLTLIDPKERNPQPHELTLP